LTLVLVIASAGPSSGIGASVGLALPQSQSIFCLI